MPDPADNVAPVTEIAAQLAARLEGIGCEYAFGGAIALGYWTEPRGTIDVDVTLYLSVEETRQTIEVLRKVGADFAEAATNESLAQHGFCRVEFLNRRLDVFLPIATIYEAAKPRRRRVEMGAGQAYIWDAETLCVFKMMFFRRKDLVDVQSLLRSQGDLFDREWVEKSLLELYGQRDPRINQWRELVAEVQG
ncbi:MAG: hypothetical protein H0T51_00290 [Pirellulales bacterium]|nr:hypothetical protein [Pirellulales bacterium]